MTYVGKLIELRSYATTRDEAQTFLEDGLELLFRAFIR